MYSSITNYLKSILNRHWLLLIIAFSFYIYLLTFVSESYGSYSYMTYYKWISYLNGPITDVTSGIGFSILAIIFGTITGLGVSSISILPVNLLLSVPIFISIFSLFTKNKTIIIIGIVTLLTSVLTAYAMSIHEIGYSLVFCYLLLCVHTIKNERADLPVCICGATLAISIYFISYNASAIFVILNIIIFIISLLFSPSQNKRVLMSRNIKRHIIPAFVGVISIFGLTLFVYSTYFSHIYLSSTMEYTVFNKIYDLVFSLFFSSNTVSTTAISLYYYDATTSVLYSLLRILFHIIIFSIIGIYCLYMIRKISIKQNLRTLQYDDQIILSTVVTFGVYFTLRLLNNDLSLFLFFYVALLILFRFIESPDIKRIPINKIAVTLMILLLVIGGASSLSEQGNTISANHFAYTESAEWVIQNIPETESVAGDVGSFSYLRYIALKNLDEDDYPAQILSYTDILKICDNNYIENGGYKYVFLNMDTIANSISLVTWERVKNWEIANPNLRYNPSYNLLYNNDMMKTMQQSNQ